MAKTALNRFKKTSEQELTELLTPELKEAWLKLKRTAQSLGEQTVYASGKAIMFSKKHCYFFVRPRKTFLEVVIFLRSKNRPNFFKSIQAVSQKKFAHTFKLSHADQIEGPLMELIQKAFDES